jgi:hypothetical protein
MPSTLNSQINSSIQSFVAELTELVRSAALESVQSALGGGGGGSVSGVRRGPGRPKGSGVRRGPGRPKGSSAANSAAVPAPKPARRAKGERRSSEDVDATAAKLLAYIKANDGKRIDEIAKAMSVHTSDLKLPAQKLLAAKSVKTSGQKRGTKYHAGGKGTASKKPAKKA